MSRYVVAFLAGCLLMVPQLAFLPLSIVAHGSRPVLAVELDPCALVVTVEGGASCR